MIQLKKNYNTYLTQELADSWTGETPIYLQDNLDSDSWFLVIWAESIYYHRSVGNIAYCYYVNRVNPSYHAAWTLVMLANSIDYFNYLLTQTEEQFYIYKKNANHLVCKWGTFYVNATNVTVADLDTSLALTNKTLTSNATNYIYFVEEDFKITTTIIALEAYLIATITVNVWWEITNIVKHNTKIVGNKWEKGDQGIQWPQGIQWVPWEDWISPTVPELPTYTFTGSASDRIIDSSTATVKEMFDVMATMYNDIKLWLQAMGIQWPPWVNGANGIGIPTGGTTGQILQKASWVDYETSWFTLTWGWDMLSAMYDPTNKNQDVFAYSYSKSEADALLATKQPTIGYTTANDTAVVHLTGNETISWTKTFDNIVTNTIKVPWSAALGKVLTSDNLGNATWQNLPWSSSSYFYLTKTGTTSLPQNITTWISWDALRMSNWLSISLPSTWWIVLPAWIWLLGANVKRTLSPWVTTNLYIQIQWPSWETVSKETVSNSSWINLDSIELSTSWIVYSSWINQVAVLCYHQWGGTQTTQDICGFWGIKIA